ncbi:MAG TPA: ABC-F family ATP-binding cassette domain-containing protein, partial [Herpetosiphonaceae bacterium]|nr:ABC-F family ATP-binding cassette domain-containing protein [Herpetosiphonaceae bacterium]
MSTLSGYNLGKWYGADRIFDHVNFSVNRGDKVALVGPNGAGKSTLLKIIGGIEEPTEGSTGRARGLRLAYLAQEAHFDEGGTLLAAAERAFSHLHAIEAELRSLEELLADTEHPEWETRMERYGELHARFEHAGGYHTENVIERTLEGIGFRREHFYQDLRTFSGGQTTRAALAITLLQDPDVLLLDEPTNHLDLRALQWLETFLTDWPGTLIVISHDRYFLDRVTSRTWEMAFGKLEAYPGNYSKFVQLKAEKQDLQQKQFDAQQQYIAKTEEFIRRFGAGQRSKEAKGREKRLNRLKEGWEGADPRSAQVLIDAPKQQKALRLKLETALRSGELSLALSDGLQAGYKTPRGDKTLVRTPPLTLQRGECVALMGPNGTGKTTLLRTITGELPALAGRVENGVNTTVGYYAQVHDELDLDNTILEEVHRVKPLEPTERIRTLLARFLFSGDDIYKHVRDLSGGERSRVALAQLTLKAPNLLLLDEPTNHLDIAAREALESVLQEFTGSILFVSHDRYFVDALADKLWIVEDGTVKQFDGDYSAYMAHLAGQEAARKRSAAAVREPTLAGNGSGQANGSKAVRARERRLQALEQEIADLEARKQTITAELEAASAEQNVSAVTRLGQAYSEIEEKLLDRYDVWAEAAAGA